MRRIGKGGKVLFLVMALILAVGLTLSVAGPAAATVSSLQLAKTAQVGQGCRNYDVTLSITGTPPTKPVDVILVIDRSGSMGPNYGNDIVYAKQAAISFATSILSNSNNRVGVVSYSNSATLNQALTNNLTAVQNAINGLIANGGTNIKAGFDTASSHMASAGRDPATTARAIVLLSDGVANGGARNCATWPTSHTNCTVAAYTAGQSAQSQALVFTVGLFGGLQSGHPQCVPVARDTLQKAQNGGYWETFSGADLTPIFNIIASQVNPAATNAVVTDVVSEEFDIDAASITASQGSASVGGSTITWDVGTVGSGTVTLTYNVRAKAGYSGNLAVNDSAVVDYTDPNGNPHQTMNFSSPTVDVPEDMEAEAGDPQTISVGGSVTIGGEPTASGGIGLYTYSWLPADSLDDATAANPIASPSTTTIYRVTVADSKGCIDADEVTITVETTPENHAPVAVDDAYSTDEDTLLTVSAAEGVLANDTDEDAGNTLSAVLKDNVINGTLELYSDGSFSYDPDGDFNSSDSFTYWAYDGTEYSNLATVTITVNAKNDAPVANNDFYSTNEDTPLTVSAVDGVLGNDTDVDIGDVLSAVLVDDVSDGTLELYSDGSFSYDPDGDFNGSDSFTYQAYDGTEYSNVATVTITVNAMCDPPEAYNDSATTYVNTPVKIDVLDNDTDPDGDDLWVIDVGDPLHGNVVVNEDDTVTYTPYEGYTGSDSFEYTISDCYNEGPSECEGECEYTIDSIGEIVDSPCCNTDTATVTVTVKQKGEPGPSNCGLLAIEVRPASATIAVGKTQEFHAWAIYDICDEVDATADVTWESGNESIATVSSSGVATGEDIGETTITATLTSLGKSDSATLTVTARQATVERIVVEPDSASIAVGGAKQFTATAYYEGNPVGVNVTGTATWGSSESGVASVASGLAAGVAPGVTDITAEKDGKTSNKAELTVTASQPTLMSIVVEPDSASIAVGGAKQFTATAYYSSGDPVDVTSTATWASSESGVATIVSGSPDGGLATGKAAGITDITATLGSVTSNKAELTVTAPTVERIVVEPGDSTLPVGGTQPFTATAYYSDGSSKDVTDEVTWSSSDDSVVSIDEGGLATGEKGGDAQITASLGDVTSNSVTVSVTPSVPWSMIGGIIAAVLAAGLLFFFLMRRRKKGEPEESAAA